MESQRQSAARPCRRWPRGRARRSGGPSDSSRRRSGARPHPADTPDRLASRRHRDRQSMDGAAPRQIRCSRLDVLRLPLLNLREYADVTEFENVRENAGSSDGRADPVAFEEAHVIDFVDVIECTNQITRGKRRRPRTRRARLPALASPLVVERVYLLAGTETVEVCLDAG